MRSVVLCVVLAACVAVAFGDCKVQQCAYSGASCSHPGDLSPCVGSTYCDTKTTRCTALLEDGNACTDDRQCKSGGCNNGFCSSTWLLYAGQTCSNSYDCLNKNCTNGRCAFLPLGAACTGYDYDKCDYTTSFCSYDSHTCKARIATGENCTERATVSYFETCVTGTCLNGKCSAKLAEGQACTAGYDCLTGICGASVNGASLKCMKRFSIPVGGVCSKYDSLEYQGCVAGSYCDIASGDDGVCKSVVLTNANCANNHDSCATCGCNYNIGNYTCSYVGYEPNIYSTALGSDDCIQSCYIRKNYGDTHDQYYDDPTTDIFYYSSYRLTQHFSCLQNKCGKYKNDICQAYNYFKISVTPLESCLFADLTQNMTDYCGSSTTVAASTGSQGTTGGDNNDSSVANVLIVSTIASILALLVLLL